MNGLIKMTNPKGYGFIRVDGHDKDVFFHCKDFRGNDFSALKEGDKVKIDRVETNPVTNKNIAREVCLV